MNGRALSEAAERFLRGRDRVTIDEISLAVTGRRERELRPIELAVLVARLEPPQWRKVRSGCYIKFC
jgi:hypothetical protein